MKTWKKVVLGIVVGLAVLVGSIFWLTGDITKTGDDFFAAVQNDDIDAAYVLLSDNFQAGTSKEELKSYLTDNALDNVTETYWGSRSKFGETGELKGTVTTADGSKIQLELILINSEAGWRINAIEMANAGFRRPDASRPVPSAKKQQQLFRDTIAAFAESLSDKSMKKLRDYSSGSFRQQKSLEEFDKAYEYSYKWAEDYLAISKMSPIIDDAKVDEKGGLNIRGHYQIKPKPVHFHQVYIYEGIDWKLVGLVYGVGSPPPK